MSIWSHKVAINIYIGIGVVLVSILILAGIFGGANNKYVGLTETVNTGKSNISKEEQRRVDLFNNLVDAVKSAKAFEQDTLVKIAEARGLANSGKIEQAQLTLAAVVEAYPEIKSTELYKQTMLEFSATENRLAQYREQYNDNIKQFNGYVQGFPSAIILNIIGKDTTPKEYLDYEVDNSEARNLFDN